MLRFHTPLIEPDRRISCPADVDEFTTRFAKRYRLRRAVVNNSTLFVQGLVCELQLLRTTIQNYDKQIETIVQQHPDFPFVSSFSGIGKALAPRLIAAAVFLHLRN